MIMINPKISEPKFENTEQHLSTNMFLIFKMEKLNFTVERINRSSHG